MSFSTGSSAQQSEINVTPLIDVLLVLLIIFMVIVPALPHGLQSYVPQGKASTEPVTLPPVIVEVLAGSRYRVNQHDVPAASLRAELQTLMAARQERTLFVQADRTLSFQPVAEVVATAKQAGAFTVALQPLQR